MTNINYLLKKYNRTVPGEKQSRETARKQKQYQRIQNRQEKATIIISRLNLNKSQQDGVRYLIDTCTNFKNIHRTASEECIITAFCFHFMKLENSKVRIHEYRICKEYNLADSTFELISCRLLEFFMKKAPLIPNDTSKVDHNILVKQAY